jgi:hypothetical protein
VGPLAFNCNGNGNGNGTPAETKNKKGRIGKVGTRKEVRTSGTCSERAGGIGVAPRSSSLTATNYDGGACRGVVVESRQGDMADFQCTGFEQSKVTVALPARRADRGDCRELLGGIFAGQCQHPTRILGEVVESRTGDMADFQCTDFEKFNVTDELPTRHEKSRAAVKRYEPKKIRVYEKKYIQRP